MNVNHDVYAVGSNSNDEVSKETTTNELPSALSCNLGILNEIDQIVKEGKEVGTNQLISYFIQIGDITSNARRTLIRYSTQVDGFVPDVLERNCFDALE